MLVRPPFVYGIKYPGGPTPIWEGRAGADAAADIISTVEFDHTGNYLATGDKGGRVVLFERNESVSRVPACISDDHAGRVDACFCAFHGAAELGLPSGQT